MFFVSDNASPAHPAVIEALGAAGAGHAMPYGAEALMDQVRDRLRDVFEAPRAEIYLVATGTGANSLILGSLTRPWQVIFATEMAHVFEDECNAPEFYTGGAKLRAVASRDGRMQPQALEVALEQGWGDVHQGARGPVSLTNLTELGTTYTPDQIARLAAIAHGHDLPVHLDGARLANALVATGASPADMTWRAGVDALSLGATKNGAMALEAVMFFDPDQGRDFPWRRMRGGHLFSKHRYLSAQMLAYLTDDLWLDLATRANRANRLLARGLARADGVTILHDPQGNITFARWSRALHQRLLAAGAQYYVMDGDPASGAPDQLLTARLVSSWCTSDDDVARFLDVLSA